MFDGTDGLPMDLSPEVEAALKAVGACWGDEAAAESHVLAALALAPDSLAVRIGAYKFYLYRHRLNDALPHACACLGFAASALNLPSEWQAVTGPLDGAAAMPRLWLQSLMAMGYSWARLGRLDESRLALGRVAELDSADKLGARRLLAVVERGGLDPDDDL